MSLCCNFLNFTERPYLRKKYVRLLLKFNENAKNYCFIYKLFYLQFFPGVLFLVTVQFYLTNDVRENSNCSTSWNIVCYQVQSMRSDDAFARINLAWTKMIFYEIKRHIGGHWFWVDSSEFWYFGAFWWRWTGKHLGWVRLGEALRI